MDTTTFDMGVINGMITYNDKMITITGNTPITSGGYLYYWAANPVEYKYSYSGSGLPFPNPEIAYENTTNKGRIHILNGGFSFTVITPNAYYINLGTVKIVPHINIQLYNEYDEQMSEVINLKVGNGMSYRSLTYPPFRSSPQFYNIDFEARSQEQILFDSAYPSTLNNAYVKSVPVNHWGNKPAR